MPQHIGLIAVVVRDYDEAIAFYTTKLGFRVCEDVVLDESKRWVVLSVDSDAQTRLLLAKAATKDETRHIGNQTGGRVGFFLYSDNFSSDYTRMQQAGVHFEEEPRQESYGTVAIFQDLYGNRWDLLQPAQSSKHL